jgi:predicted RNase H-like nuclease (RuvC/YqgF family)
MNEGMQNLKEIEDLENKLTETKKLKEMLSQGWKEIRASKNKTWPRFGIEMFLLQCIIQCNKALDEKKSEENE